MISNGKKQSVPEEGKKTKKILESNPGINNKTLYVKGKEKRKKIYWQLDIKIKFEKIYNIFDRISGYQANYWDILPNVLNQTLYEGEPLLNYESGIIYVVDPNYPKPEYFKIQFNLTESLYLAIHKIQIQIHNNYLKHEYIITGENKYPEPLPPLMDITRDKDGKIISEKEKPDQETRYGKEETKEVNRIKVVQAISKHEMLKTHHPTDQEYYNRILKLISKINKNAKSEDELSWLKTGIPSPRKQWTKRINSAFKDEIIKEL